MATKTRTRIPPTRPASALARTPIARAVGRCEARLDLAVHVGPLPEPSAWAMLRAALGWR